MGKISAVFLFFAFFSIVFLVALGGCIQPPVCDDGSCVVGIEDNPNSPLYCQADCGPLPGNLEVEIISSFMGSDPLEGAEVKAGIAGGSTEETRWTNSDGIALFESLPAGAYNITASKNGYLPADANVEVIAGQKTSVRIKLPFHPVIPGYNCGDGNCTYPEDENNCLADCRAEECGNNICEIGETEESCPADCAGLDLQVSIQTEKDVFLKGETILLTDPPELGLSQDSFEPGFELVQGMEETGYQNYSPNPVSKRLMKSRQPDYNAFIRESEVQTKGYIVKLKLPPLLQKFNELESKVKKGLISAGVSAAQYNSYKTQLASAQQAAITSFKSILGQVKVMQKFTKVLNAVSLDISEKEAEKLLQSPFVEKIYPNRTVKVLLNDSVPQINADKLWQLTDASGNNITGKGATIAIIDTGIDYRHPWLGSCFVENVENTETCFPEKKQRIPGTYSVYGEAYNACVDTDGGKNICHQGIAYYEPLEYFTIGEETAPIFVLVSVNEQDYCQRDVFTGKYYLYEQYCADGIGIQETEKISCPNGCKGNMCVTANNINNGSCGKVIGGYDFVNNDNDPMDDHGHGTHVAGIAAGNGELKGVAPDAKLFAYKVLAEDGYGQDDWIIAAIERAVDPNQDGNIADHVDVVNMSIGGFGYPDDPLSQSVDNAVDAGVIVVVAAGNNGWYFGIDSPGAARKAITVGATCKKTDVGGLCMGDIGPFSSLGPTFLGTLKPDVLAPGTSICSAQHDALDELGFQYGKTQLHCIEDTSVTEMGTSMASPHVAGAAALLLQAHPDWKPAEVKAALMQTAKHTTIPRYVGKQYAFNELDLSIGEEVCLKFELEIESNVWGDAELSILGPKPMEPYPEIKGNIRAGRDNPGEIIQTKTLNGFPISYGGFENLYFDYVFDTLPAGGYWFCMETLPWLNDINRPRLLFDFEDNYTEKYLKDGQWEQLDGKDLMMYTIFLGKSNVFEEGSGEIDLLEATNTPFMVTPSPIDLTANSKASSYSKNFSLMVKNIKSAAAGFSVSAEIDSSIPLDKFFAEPSAPTGIGVSISPTNVSFGETQFTLNIFTQNGAPFDNNRVYYGLIKFYSPADKKTLHLPFSFTIDYSAPTIISQIPFIEINEDLGKYEVGIRVITNEISDVRMYYRLLGSTTFNETAFKPCDLRYRESTQSLYCLYQKELDWTPGVYEFFLTATNDFGGSTTENNDGKLFRLSVPAGINGSINSTGYNLTTTVPGVMILKDSAGNYLDFDRDGKKELLSSRGGITFNVLENDGYTFRSSAVTTDYTGGGISPYGIADTDKDNRQELIFLDGCGIRTGSSGECHARWGIVEQTTSVSLNFKQIFKSDYAPSGVKITDADNDGKKEIMVIVKSSVAGEYRLLFYEAIADNNFAIVNQLNALNFLAEADLDKDGKKEIIVRQRDDTGIYVRFYEASGDNNFEAVAQLPYYQTPFGIAVADIDGDNQNELVLIDRASRISIFKSTGDNRFEESYNDRLIKEPAYVETASLGDLDGDGKKEIILGWWNESYGAWWNGYYGSKLKLINTLFWWNEKKLTPTNSIITHYLMDLDGSDRYIGYEYYNSMPIVSASNLTGNLNDEIIIGSSGELLVSAGGLLEGYKSSKAYIFSTLTASNGAEPIYQIDCPVEGNTRSNVSTFDHYNTKYAKLILSTIRGRMTADNWNSMIFSFPIPEKSQISNNSSKAVQGKLAMKVQFWDGGAWVDEKVVVNNDPISIEANSVFALDKEWAAKGAYLANKSGRFRVFVSFEFASQTIEDFYEFTVA